MEQSNNPTHATVTMSTDTSVDEQSYVDGLLQEVDEHDKAMDAIGEPDSTLFTEEQGKADAATEEEEETDKGDQEEAEQGAFSFEKYGSEIEETGELSDESLAELEAHGFDRDSMKQYVEGIEAQRELAEMKAFASVGGEDNYREMLEWAGTNMSDADIDMFNEAVTDPKVRDKAIAAMYQEYRDNVGTDTELLMGSRPTQTANAYTSFEQLVADQSDPRYDVDPAFRAHVMQKLSRSKI